MRFIAPRPCDAPRPVPHGAVHLATLDLRSRLGLAWREKIWLLRHDGRDSLWAAVADAPERAAPVGAADTAGTPEEAGARLLAGYLAVSGAEPSLAPDGTAGGGLMPAAELAALVALRRAGWKRH